MPCEPTHKDCEAVVQRVRSALSLSGAALSDEYLYGSLTLCVIDAVFSIGVRYEGVQAVVQRYCTSFGVARYRSRTGQESSVVQESISDLLQRFAEHGPEYMASQVFRNRQRTSSRSGTLKSAAVGQFAKVLRDHGIEHLQDIGASLPSPALEKDIRSIKGQGSGISLQYFWMLAGSDELIKPDRMILGFLSYATGREVHQAEALPLLQCAVERLRGEFSHLTPRLLDYEIWKYQRDWLKQVNARTN